MGKNSSQFQRLVLLGALFLLPLSSASARHRPVELPTDSPAWWTLTDEFSPEELRRAHHDPEANLQRYLKDLEIRETRPLPAHKAQRLIFHVNGGAEPELVPLWWAFGAMATVRTLRQQLSPETLIRSDGQLLADFGVSPEGVRQILEVADLHRDLLYEREVELEPLWEEFTKFRQRAVRSLGGDEEARERVRDATYASDARFLAPLGKEDLPKTAELLEAMNADVLLEVAMRSLPELRQNLGDADWNGMRRFFLTYIAPSFGSAQGFKPSHEESRDAATSP